MPSQKSTFDQLVDLVGLANKAGLYDASDWLVTELRHWQAKWHHAAIEKGPKIEDPIERGKAIQEWRENERVYAAAISQNRVRRMKGLPLIPVPERTSQPLVPVAYSQDGTYEGVLKYLDECPPGCVVKWQLPGKISVLLTANGLRRRPDYFEKQSDEEQPPDAISRYDMLRWLENSNVDWVDFTLGSTPLELEESWNDRKANRFHITFRQVAKNASKIVFHPEDMEGHYLWEANGDEAIIISPDHQIKTLPFEQAQVFWDKLFEFEEQIENPDELQKAIDEFCATYFQPESKTANDLTGRIEKASKELADLWPKSTPAEQRGYAIAHSLHTVQDLLKQALAESAANPDAANLKVSRAEDTLRETVKQIAHLNL